MLTEERQAKILELIHSSGQVNVSEICAAFNVSEMTARRDLKQLDQQGLVRRIHGGAIANLGRSYEPPFRSRAVKNEEAKMAIGRKAAEMVHDGESIALDVGTTTLEIVPGLRGKRNLTIVTSCLPIAARIVDQIALEVDARLILTGGIIRPRELSMIGYIPKWVYQDLHVDKAFIGAGGISLEDGLTEYNVEDTEVKRMLIRSAREKIVVADGTKFGVTTFASIAPLTAVDKIITDKSAPSELLERIREQGVEVVLAE